METFSEIFWAGVKKYCVQIVAASLFGLTLIIFPGLRRVLVKFSDFVKNSLRKSPEQKEKFVPVSSGNVERKRTHVDTNRFLFGIIFVVFLCIVLALLFKFGEDALKFIFPLYLLLAILFVPLQFRPVSKNEIAKAETGDADLQYSLAEHYAVKDQNRNAYMWYYVATMSGHKSAAEKCKKLERKKKISPSEALEAQSEAGKIYTKIQTRLKLEFEKFRELSMKGDSVAQYNLGWMYQHGEHVQQDNFRAYVWYYLADLCGDAAANAQLKQFAEKLFPSQIEAAQSEAREKFAAIKKFLEVK